MQIGPTSSALQALGTSPAAPETMRMKVAGDARPAAEAADAARPGLDARPAAAGPGIDPVALNDGHNPALDAPRRGTRVDMLV